MSHPKQHPVRIWTAAAAATLLAVPLLGGAEPVAPKNDQAPSLDELLGLPEQNTGRPKTGTGDRPKIELPEADPQRDPFKLAVADMKSAAGRLADQKDPGLQTQRDQQRAIKRLEQMLAMLRQQNNSKNSKSQQQQQQQPQQPDSGSQKNQPNQGQQQGQQQQQGQSQQQANQAGQSSGGGNGGPDEKKLDPLNERLSEWGNLPPRLRDQLLEGLD
ncbi:MAG: hypothetical protein R3236_04105, partial [Phycisphaeraceae bacterium]|nr:hypothetical protein [Phycisphaeraceae bacterium]